MQGSKVSKVERLAVNTFWYQVSSIAHRDEKYVALKVVKSAPHYIETAADEIRLLEAIRDADPLDVKRERIVRLLNHFTVRGVNGVHTCLVFEALGCSLYKLIVKNNYQGLAIAQVRNIIKQVLEGLDYLHSKCSIIHTDIKPENILLVIDNAAAMNQQIDDEINSLRVKGVDFPDSYSKIAKAQCPKSPESTHSSSCLPCSQLDREADEDEGQVAADRAEWLHDHEQQHGEQLDFIDAAGRCGHVLAGQGRHHHLVDAQLQHHILAGIQVLQPPGRQRVQRRWPGQRVWRR